MFVPNSSYIFLPVIFPPLHKSAFFKDDINVFKIFITAEYVSSPLTGKTVQTSGMFECLPQC